MQRSTYIGRVSCSAALARGRTAARLAAAERRWRGRGQVLQLERDGSGWAEVKERSGPPANKNDRGTERSREADGAQHREPDGPVLSCLQTMAAWMDQTPTWRHGMAAQPRPRNRAKRDRGPSRARAARVLLRRGVEDGHCSTTVTTTVSVAMKRDGAADVARAEKGLDAASLDPEGQ